MRLDWRAGILAISLCVMALEVATAAPPAQAVAVPLTAAPTVSRVFADGLDVVIAWYGVKGATGYEVMRAPDPQQPATKVASLSDTSLGYRDRWAGAGPVYYQIVAVGAGNSRVASAWFPFNASTSGTITTAAASTGMSTHGPIVATTATGAQPSGVTAQCGCVGGQGPAGPQGPSGPPGPAGPAGPQGPSGATKDVLQQIASLQAQVDALKALITLGANGVTQITASADQSNQTANSYVQTIGRNRAVSIGGGDNVTIGTSSATTVGTTWQLSAGQSVVINAGDGILLKTGSASVQLSKDGSITILGNNIAVQSAGTLLLQAGSSITIRAPQVVNN